MSIFAFIYIFLFFSLIVNKFYILALLSILLIPVAIVIKIHIKNTKIARLKKEIENAKNRFKKNDKIEPFLDINKEPWYILDLIPGITRVNAKKVANRVKKLKIESFEEFANICGLEPALNALVKAIVKL